MNENPSNTPSQPSAVLPSLPPGSPPDSPYKGYGGWLAFFCIVQIFIGPLVAIISGAANLSGLGQVADRYPGLVFVTIVECIGDIALVGFGVYAGITLRRLRPGAVGIAKRYLLTRLGWAVLSLALPSLGGPLPSQVTEAMMIALVKGLVQTALVFAIWYSYFNVSKRVKATFPEG